MDAQEINQGERAEWREESAAQALNNGQKEKEVLERCGLRSRGATKDLLVHRSQGREFGEVERAGSMGCCHALGIHKTTKICGPPS